MATIQEEITDELEPIIDKSPDTSIVDNVSGTLEGVSEAFAKGREVAAERVPVMIDSAKQAVDQAQTTTKQALGEAQARVDRLSDVGIAAAAGVSLGVSAALLLTGAPRILLALSAVPLALTVRSAMGRGMGPSSLRGTEEV